MVPRGQYQALHDALATVQLNGQAIAAADLCIGALTEARDQFSAWSFDVSRRDAAARLDAAVADVRMFRRPFEGMAAAGVNPSSWDDLSHAIKRGYNLLWSVQDVQGDETEWQATLSYLGSMVTGTIQAMPGVIRDAVHFTSEVATDTVGGVAAGLLPLWPLVLVAIVGLAGAAVAAGALRKKGLIR